MTLTPPDPDNIVALHPDSKKELEITNKVQEHKYTCPGRCTKIEVDSITRTVTCTQCGFTLDPFDYLQQWAVEGDRRMSALKTIEIKTKIAHTEHADLMRKIKNMRQTLKRHGQPQPELERLEYDNQRLNAHP